MIHASDKIGVYVAILILIGTCGAAGAQEKGAPGTVRLPLDEYSRLFSLANKPPDKETPPPVRFSISDAAVRVSAPTQAGQPAEVSASVKIHVLSSDWVSIGLLPAGTSLKSATMDGVNIALSVVGGELVFPTRKKGKHELKLEYSVPVLEAAVGKSLSVPLPAAAVINLEAVVPGEGLAVSAVPASGVKLESRSGSTVLQASVPRTSMLLIAWHAPLSKGALITGADYAGTLKGSVVAWRARVGVKLMDPEPYTLDLLSAAVALARARVDGKDAIALEHEGHLAIQLWGAGKHEVTLEFETPVVQEGGPTSTTIWLPRPPASSFRLTLDGKKEVTVSPKAGVEISRRGGRTEALIHLPPADSATFSWSAALPQVAEEKMRANAEVYHLVRAEEGVVQVDALIDYHVTRGATNSLSVALPPTVVVNHVTGVGVSDWRVVEAHKRRLLNIYLDRDLTSDYRYQITYELLTGSGAAENEPLVIPMLAQADVHRQRGMLALVAGSELSMNPDKAQGMTRVGENQLPAWVREKVEQTVAHTYKYVDTDSRLTVKLAPPERKRGRFDAVVDTLFSIADGVMKASASVKISIKSGKIMDLDMSLPKDINLINVSAPSMRDYKLSGQEGSGQSLHLMFTQEMEGTLRVEIAYERVLGGEHEKVLVPVIHVDGADTEQGRLAVEALTAVEVKTADDCQAIKDKRVLFLDVQELPRQLTLRTTNPILLAYKYVHATPPFELVLQVKHHEEMKVQVASIDRAVYQTLYTKDGLALTKVNYEVRNRRKQFLKVRLPEGSKIWSARLAGQPVKPASGEGQGEVLVPLLKSANPFQVEIVYKSDIGAVGFAGWLSGTLPVSDIVETRSLWEIFLPESLTYGRVDTNMTILGDGGSAGDTRTMPTDTGMDGSELKQITAAGQTETRSDRTPTGAVGVLPLRIDVPRRGVHFRFEKLYANRGKEPAHFSIHYTTSGASSSGSALMILAVLMLAGLAAGRAGLWKIRLGPAQSMIVGLGALAVIVIAGFFLGAQIIWAAITAGLAAAALFAAAILRNRQRISRPGR